MPTLNQNKTGKVQINNRGAWLTIATATHKLANAGHSAAKLVQMDGTTYTVWFSSTGWTIADGLEGQLLDYARRAYGIVTREGRSPSLPLSH